MFVPPDPAAGMSRPMPWVPPMVYAAVLIGGLYGGLVATARGSAVDPPRVSAFAACLLLLLALDYGERRRHPVRTPARTALVLFVVRLTLFAAASGLDSSGVSRALFVLVPLTAYFAFGRQAGIALTVACVGAALAGNALWVPGWYLRSDVIADLLMSGLALVLAVTMATIAVGAQDGRARLARTLDELRDSHTQLTAYAEQVAGLSAAQERNRLARDFHDGLGHHLTAIAIQLEKASAFHGLDPEVAQRAVADARWSASRALNEVRQSVRALRDEDAPFLLSSALEDLVRHIDAGPTRVTLELSGDERGCHTEALTALYRAAQEGLTNAHRHSHASRITVSVAYGEREVRLVVADDGRGFPSATDGGDGFGFGFGLRAMRERLTPLRGHVDVDAAPGRGTVVTVTVPRVPAATAVPTAVL